MTEPECQKQRSECRIMKWSHCLDASKVAILNEFLEATQTYFNPAIDGAETPSPK